MSSSNGTSSQTNSCGNEDLDYVTSITVLIIRRDLRGIVARSGIYEREYLSKSPRLGTKLIRGF